MDQIMDGDATSQYQVANLIPSSQHDAGHVSAASAVKVDSNPM